MGNLSNVHDIVPLLDGSKPFSGQRLCKLRFRKTEKAQKEGKKVPDNACVSIPQVQLPEGWNTEERLKIHVIRMLEAGQDGIILGLYAEEGKREITDSDISFGKILDYLDAAQDGGRLTKEAIMEWLNSSGTVDNLVLTVAAAWKLPSELTPEMEVKLNAVVGQYCEKIAGLAGGKTQYPPEVCDQLIKVLNACAPADDKLTTSFLARLEKMKEKSNSVLEDLGL
jgi:hypothetical protein